jgi:hypothetical protein
MSLEMEFWQVLLFAAAAGSVSLTVAGSMCVGRGMTTSAREIVAWLGVYAAVAMLRIYPDILCGIIER